MGHHTRPTIDSEYRAQTAQKNWWQVLWHHTVRCNTALSTEYPVRPPPPPHRYQNIPHLLPESVLVTCIIVGEVPGQGNNPD